MDSVTKTNNTPPPPPPNYKYCKNIFLKKRAHPCRRLCMTFFSTAFPFKCLSLLQNLSIVASFTSFPIHSTFSQFLSICSLQLLIP